MSNLNKIFTYQKQNHANVAFSIVKFSILTVLAVKNTPGNVSYGIRGPKFTYEMLYYYFVLFVCNLESKRIGKRGSLS